MVLTLLKILAVANNHGPAGIGQAKWMAHSALVALRVGNPSLAEDIENNLPGPDMPIASWDPPIVPMDRDTVQASVANAMRDGILHDLRNHQPQP